MLFFLIVSLFTVQCQRAENKHVFVDNVYNASKPIAEIKNLPRFSSSSQSFSIDQKEKAVQVYAVGEILYNLRESDKKYYLMGDDIKLFFRTGKNEDRTLHRQEYVFAYKDVKKFIKDSIIFKWNTLNENTKYIAEFKIPFRNLNLYSSGDNDSTNFNIAVGDNDDGFIQTTEIRWLKNSYGNIVFRKDSSTEIKTQQFLSSYGTPDVDGTIDPIWNKTESVKLDKVTRGYVKDPLDLSVSARSLWDKDFIYFLLEINDSRQKHIPPKKEAEREIFVDYGWIENEKGEVIWSMRAKHSKHAGGMLKNQQIDTTLILPVGKYTLKYITDESHSHNDWIGAPPSTPFYGIVLYEKLSR